MFRCLRHEIIQIKDILASFILLKLNGSTSLACIVCSTEWFFWYEPVDSEKK